MHASLLQSRTSRLLSKAAVSSHRRMPAHRTELVICMAHPRRVAKVSSQIQREISEMFIYDKVVQQAICPERRAGLDDQLSAVASITHVYVSNDLQVVKVYVSVYSDDEGKEQAINNLKRIAPYVRSRIGQAVRLRLTPEIRFEYDDAYDEFDKIQAAIGQEDFARYIAEAEADREGSLASSSPAGVVPSAVAYAADDNDDDEADDDDSGFFDIEDAEGDADAGPGPGPGPSSSRLQSSRSNVRPASAASPPSSGVDEDEVDDDDFDEVDETGGAWYNRTGPFDDLFGGSWESDDLAQEKQQRRRPKGSRGGGKHKQLQS